MISDIKIYDSNLINYVSVDDLSYPVQKFEWAYPIVGDTIRRPFSAGRHDTRKSVEDMTIDMEGEILGATTSDYWAKRKALAAVVLPLPEQIAAVYRHSRIIITLDDSTVYHADVQLASYAMPLATTGAPTISPFMLSWECNAGYWSSSLGAPTRL